MTKARTLADNYAADISGITAGTGITGGGTSGTVTITNDMATTIAAKGDIIIGSANDAYNRLAVGTNNYVLTADSAETLGVKWASAGGGGKLLQLVSATYSTKVTSNSASFADTGLTATITPSSASSTILVLCHLMCEKTSASVDLGIGLRLVRGATSIHQFVGDGMNNNVAQIQYISFDDVYLDSPATTSATTYKVQFNSESATSTVAVQYRSLPSTLVLMEIGA